MKKCPKCGTMMTIGSPHADGYAHQWECHNCGYIEPVGREPEGVGHGMEDD